MEKYQLQYPQKTMYEAIAAMVQEYPTDIAYEFYGVKTPYRKFGEKISRAARALTANGVREGDRVTICLPNIPQALDCFYAINRIGAVANMIHPLSAEKEIAFYLNISKSRLILTVDMFYEKVKKALADVDHPVTILVARMQDELPPHMALLYTAKAGRTYLKFPGKNSGEDKTWKSFLKEGDSFGGQLPEVHFDRNRTAVILYSGGTSGTPKGICLSDFNFNALAMQCRMILPVEFKNGLKMLSCMPLFHGFGLGINIHAVLFHGATCILMPSFNNKSYAKALLKKKPNFIAGVPTIFEALLHVKGMEKADLSYLVGVFCGGDSLSVELKKKVDAFLEEHGSEVPIQEGYGLTECVTASCLTPYDHYKEGSIGLPFPDTDYAIVRPGTDDVLHPGEEGEIILTGPTVMLDYLDNEKETKDTLRTLSDGRVWLYTGDLGYMDEDGFVYFKQRIKRMIVTNGYNVYPGQIENVIDSVPEIAYSCVIGLPDPRRGQRVKAFAVMRDGVTDEEVVRGKIKEALAKNVARYAIPREIEFRRELPKTLVGKVAYRKLEEEEAEKRAAVQAGGNTGNE